MGRSRLIAPVLLAGATLAVSATAPADETSAQAFLRKTVGFTDAQVAAVEAGQVVTKALPSADKPEIAAFGAVRVRGDVGAFLRQLRDGVASRRRPSILESGRFSRPPKAGSGGFYLLDLYRARIDPPTGMLSGVILGKIRGGIEQGVAEGLSAARARAEAK